MYWGRNFTHVNVMSLVSPQLSDPRSGNSTPRIQSVVEMADDEGVPR